MSNGKDRSHPAVCSSKPPSSSSSSAGLAQQQKAQAAASSYRGEFDRRRYHSTPPESTVGSTPPQELLADSRHQPIASAVSVASSKSLRGVNMYSRPRVNSDTAACVRPQSPHSPLLMKQASLHLAGIIGRQQERERSCTPSPRTPTQSKFSFPSLDADDSSSSTSRGTESTLTSEKAKKMDSRDLSSTPVESTTSSLSVGDSDRQRQQPKAFAEGLKFIDTPSDQCDIETDTIPVPLSTTIAIATTSSSTTNKPTLGAEMAATATTTSTVGNSPVKSQIVFRPIHEVHNEDITIISGCKFFDPSQSQTDYYTPPPPLHHISSVSLSETEREVNKSKDKGRKAKSKESKSFLKSKRKNSSGTPDPEEKAKDGEEVPTIGERKSKEKEEKAEKKVTMKKKRSISMSEADVGSGQLPTLASPTGKPPLPATAAVKKGYWSFRGDVRDHSMSPDSTNLSKHSTSSLTSPVHSSSRGTTPESSTSENEDQKRKSSLRNKLKSLMGKDKNSSKATGTSWKFSDIGGVAQSDSDVVVALKGFRKLDEEDEGEQNSPQDRNATLRSTGSGNQLSLMTHKDRLIMLEDTEVVPRTYSIECIRPTYNEMYVDVPAIGEVIETKPKSSSTADNAAKKDKDGDSTSCGSEYLTASDSGSVTKMTCEAEKEKEQLLRIPVTTSSTNLSQETLSDKFLTPPESGCLSQTSLELSVMGVMDKVLNPSSSATKSKPSLSNKLISPSAKSPSKGPSTRSSSIKVPSPRASPISSRKSSNRLSSPLTGRKTSGASSPGVSKKKVSTTSSTTASHSPSPVRKSGSNTNISPRASPISARTGTAGKKPTDSPLTQKRLTASPGSSPVPTRKSASTRSSLTSSTSPLNTRRAGSVRVAPSASASPKSSPSTKRKVSSSSFHTSGTKPSPPMISKMSLDSTTPSEPSQRSSSFSRFTPGRTPIKVKSVRQNESTAEKVQRLKEKRRSLADAKLLAETVSASCPTTPQISGPGSKSRPKTKPPSNLNLSQPVTGPAEPDSPHTSNSSSPSTPSRRRKFGISMPASPLIEIPPTLPEVESPSPSAQQQEESNTPQPVSSGGGFGFDLDSMLVSVDAKLNKMAEQEGNVKQLLKLQPVEVPPDIALMPATVFISPVHSRGSSLDIEGEDSLPISPIDTPIPTAPRKKLSAPPPSTGKSKSLVASKKVKSSPSVSSKNQAAAKKSINESSAQTSKKSKAGGLKIIKTRLSIPTRGSKDKLSPVLEKKETPSPSPGLLKNKKKRTSADSTVPSSLSASTSQKFTSARPPRPPMMSRLPSDSSVQSHRLSSVDKPPIAPTTTTSSTGQKRPRTVVAGRPSATATRLPASSASASSSSDILMSKSSSTLSNASSGSGDVSKSKSSSALSAGSNKSLPGRSGLRASAKTKKLSTTAHGNSNTKSNLSAESLLRRISIGRQSMKTKSGTQLRPGSAASRKISAANEVEKPAAQKPMRRVSSGEVLPKKIKPGASATLTRDRRVSHQVTTSSGGGRASTLSRPSSASTIGLSRSSVTRSLRLSRGTSGRRSTTTPPRAPMLTRKASPASTSALLSPTRKNSSMRRTSSGGEVLAAFDHISAQAQGSM